MLRTALASIALSLALSAWSQANEPGDLETFVAERFAASLSPGAAVAVVRDGKVVFAKGLGKADLENDLPVTPETVFRIGSVTKPFTATIVMQLVGEGKLTLETKARDVLPELPEAWSEVTVRQLLDHTSGIPSYTDLEAFFPEWSMRPTTPRGVLDLVKDLPLAFAPGTDWAYNNTAYVLLGLLVEKVEGRPFAESLQARILGPLEMGSTVFTTGNSLVPKRARGYTRSEGKPVNASYLDMVWPYSAGSMESTVLDLAKLDAALYGEGLLPQATLATMWTEAKPGGKGHGYGLGWAVGDANGTRIVEHGGGINGFVCSFRRCPEKRLTVVVLLNTDSADPSAFASAVMGFVEPSLKAPEPESQPDADPAATADARALFEALRAGTLDEGRLTEEFAREFPAATRARAATQLQSLGEIEAFTFLREDEEGEARVRQYDVRLGALTLRLKITTRPDGKVTGINAVPRGSSS